MPLRLRRQHERTSAPPVAWRGGDTYFDKTGLKRDLGTCDATDEFHRKHRQEFSRLRGCLCRRTVRHWMDPHLRAIRSGRLLAATAGAKAEHRHEEPRRAA